MPKPKRLSTEDQLSLLRQLCANPASPQTLPALEQLLKLPSLHGIVLKSIATLADQTNARSLAPLLANAVLSLTKSDATKRDPGCEAKTAILQTLLSWDADLPDLYITLSTFQQFTPTFGDPVDAAAELRGLAAIGIALTRPPNAIFLLIDLLTDPEKLTRAKAAAALSLWRGPEALPLLRLKARIGDPDPEVTTELLASLLHLDPQDHLQFVADFLQNPDPKTIEAAALALGQSKLETALPHLTHAYLHNRHPAITSTLLLSISLLRTDDALDWLLNQLPTANKSQSLNLLDALHVHHTDPKLISRLTTLITTHPHLQSHYDEVFKPPHTKYPPHALARSPLHRLWH